MLLGARSQEVTVSADSLKTPAVGSQSELAEIRRETLASLDGAQAISRSSEDTSLLQLFVLSARSYESTLQVAAKLREWASVRVDFEQYFVDLAYNLFKRRSIMQWRYSFVAGSHQEFMIGLSQKILATKVSENRRVVFVFTGQGAQWAGMGRELLNTHSKFAESLMKSDALLQGMGASWSLVDELRFDSSKSRLNRSEIAQPASTALQIALVDFLAILGISPQIVLGHSSGEIGAAYAAGALSHESAVKIAYCRSFVSNLCRQKVSSRGAMLTVGLGEHELSPLFAKIRKGMVSLACVNSPSSTTVSGDEVAILEMSDTLTQLGIFNRRLNVDTAYHSHHMRIVADDYLCSLGTVEQLALRDGVRFISTVTAEEKITDFGSAYWVENLVSKVRFCDALRAYCRGEISTSTTTTVPPTQLIIEIGPHKVLDTPIRQTIATGFDSFNHVYLPTLVRGRGAVHSILELAGKLFNLGHPVDLITANALGSSPRQFRVFHDLPTYPWDYSQTHWHESRLSKDYRLRVHPPHDLLGVRMTSNTPLEPCWRHVINIDSLPWLADHVIDGLIIFPGAGYLCMALEALRQCIQERHQYRKIRYLYLRRVYFSKALVIPPVPATVELQICLRTQQSEKALCYEFRIFAVSQDEVWHQYCRGQMMADLAAQPATVCDADQFDLDQHSSTKRDLHVKTMLTGCVQTMDSETVYDQLRSNGNFYGPCFARIDELSMGENQAISKMSVADVQSIMPYSYQQPHIIHPTTLDALLHAALPLYTQKHGSGSIMPVAIHEITISPSISNAPGTRLLAATVLTSTGLRSARAEISVFEADEEKGQDPVLMVCHAHIQGLGPTSACDSHLPQTCTASYLMEWAPDIDHISSHLNDTPSHISIKGFLKHLHFKFSEMAILEIGAGAGRNSGLIVEELSHDDTMPHAHYDFTDVDAEVVQHAQDNLQSCKTQIQFKTLDIQHDPFEQGFQSNSFDLVIATELRPDHAFEKALTNIRMLLKPGGRLVLNGISMPCKVEMQNVLLQHAYNGVELYLDNPQHQSGSGFMIVSKAANTDHQTPLPPIRIVNGEGLESFAHVLTSALKALGVQALPATWPSKRPETQEVYIVLDDGQRPLLVNPTADEFMQISNLVRARSDIIWISAQQSATTAKNPEKGLVTGFARCARAENADLRLITLDVQEAIESCLPRLLQVVMDLITTCFSNSTRDHSLVEAEYVYRDGQVLVPRLLHNSKISEWMAQEAKQSRVESRLYLQPDCLISLNIDAAPSNESLRFVSDDSTQRPLDSSTVEIAVRAHSLSLADLTRSLDSAVGSMPVVRELSGIVSALGSSASDRFRVGDRVCAWSYDGPSYANYARVEGNRVSCLSDSITFALGATIPVTFMTAYYAVVEVANLQKGQSILIHRGTSDIGKAAIHIATLIGAEVLASVATVAERHELVTQFKLRPDYVFSERAMGLKQEVLRATEDRGVDVVLNASATDWMFELCTCVTPFGVFIQVGRSTTSTSDNSVAFPADNNATIVSFDLASLIKHRPQKVAKLFEKVMLMLEHGKHVRLNQMTRISISNIESALQQARTGKHVGRIVLEADENTHVKVLHVRTSSAQQNLSKLRADATYIIAGGLGALGQKLCRFMAGCGANNIVILSRRDLGLDEKRALEDRLRLISGGLRIFTMACDISDASMLHTVVSSLEELGLPPVKGVIQSATVLRVS